MQETCGRKVFKDFYEATLYHAISMIRDVRQACTALSCTECYLDSINFKKCPSTDVPCNPFEVIGVFNEHLEKR